MGLILFINIPVCVPCHLALNHTRLNSIGSTRYPNVFIFRSGNASVKFIFKYSIKLFLLIGPTANDQY